jgi:serine/threonine protein kinase/tetratricopeptide (TPR) repeat protein
MTAQQQLAPGTTLGGKYRLLGQIGKGGMGTVWEAVELELNRSVALKIIKPRGKDGKPSTTAVGRFLREFRAMSRLRSPHVVTVYDHGSDEDRVYISMELLTGTTLRSRIKGGGPLPPEMTMRVMRHMGRAIALAHQRGIVHRDLKPGNIFLCRPEDADDDDDDVDFTTKVLDFGMAKSLSTPLATVDLVNTELGRPLGTPYYMSPEQARGKMTVDHRSDLWAMGVIAFECLTGVRPFLGKSLAAVFTQIAAGPVPVPSERGDVPQGFDAWFERALQRDIQLRFQSAKVMMEELHEVLSGATTGPVSVALNNTISDVMHTIVQPAGGSREIGGRTLVKAPASSSSSFVGRESELKQLEQALANHCRILTVTGTEGIGKGRLLREFGTRSSYRFPGGVWLCSLDNLETADALWVRLASSLGVRLSDGHAELRLGRALSRLGPVLLILDRVDGVRSQLAPALARWLRDAPSAVFACTARRKLDVPSESVTHLLGLHMPPRSASSLNDLKGFPAAQLLLRRGVAANRALLGRHDQAAAIASLCRGANGNPLAIELLAAQLATLSADQVAHGLGRALIQPGGTAIMHPDVVLQSTVRWVWAQLGLAERAALAQCACFGAGFTLQAAEAVVDLSPWPRAPTVAELVNKFAKQGLLRERRASFGEARYDMHPAVQRAFLDRLESGRGLTLDSGDEADSAGRVMQRHGAYYAQLGSEEAFEALHCRGGPVRRTRYFNEWENSEIALRRAGERGDGHIVAATCLVSAAVTSLLGRHDSAARTLLVGMSSEAASDGDKLRCTIAQGEALVANGRHAAAIELLGGATTEARALNAQRGMAQAMRALGKAQLACGQASDAERSFEQAHRLSSQHGDRLGNSEALRGLAGTALLMGNPGRAATRLREALPAYQQLGARQLEAEATAELARVLADQGYSDEASAAFNSALSIHRELGNRHAATEILGRMGELAFAGLRVDEAIGLLEQAVGRSAELGACDLEGRNMSVLAMVYARRQQYERAWQLLHQAEHLLRADGSRSDALATLLCHRAQLELASGQRDVAFKTLKEVDARRNSLHALSASRLMATVEHLRRAIGSR